MQTAPFTTSSEESFSEYITIINSPCSPEASNLYLKSYDLLTTKIAALTNTIREESEKLKVEKSSRLYKVGTRMSRDLLPIMISSFSIGAGATGIFFLIKDNIALPYQFLFAATGGFVYLSLNTLALEILSRNVNSVNNHESAIIALENELDAHKQTAACAHAIAEFNKFHSLFYKHPTLPALKQAISSFNKIPLSPPIYPANLDSETYSEAEAKSICCLFLADNMLKKLSKTANQAGSEEALGSNNEEQLINHFTASVEKRAVPNKSAFFASYSSSSSDEHVSDDANNIWKKLGIDRPSQKAAQFYDDNKVIIKNHKVATQIVHLHKGILNHLHLPTPNLETSNMLI